MHAAPERYLTIIPGDAHETRQEELQIGPQSIYQRNWARPIDSDYHIVITSGRMTFARFVEDPKEVYSAAVEPYILAFGGGVMAHAAIVIIIIIMSGDRVPNM
ncbi:hypothetical protein N7510_011363 [Penicillium lagena]|uniref:uncharacterized protein n=1 Tax=Penicillium lagena TaxID=94218 RepID=UPI0025418ADA|nr:uncharacterized protein N7510_011363 [Penicillium lagena]KAJ5601829.1 hypothetical protein N7510_011363 [Penicillium lagena]